jgi:hypothetical protein
MALTLEVSVEAQWNALDRKIRNQVRFFQQPARPEFYASGVFAAGSVM